MSSDFSLKMMVHYHGSVSPRPHLQDIKQELRIAVGAGNGKVF
jgi:hypothetical protein